MRHWYHRPFPSSRNSYSENETTCKIFRVKMSFICMRIKNHFRTNGFALSLALKKRLQPTWKWPISHFEAYRETGSVLWRIAPWDCFRNDGWFDWLLLAATGTGSKFTPKVPKYNSIQRRPGFKRKFKMANRTFSHDVTAAILAFQTHPVGAKLFSYVKLFCFNKFAQTLAMWVKNVL